MTIGLNSGGRGLKEHKGKDLAKFLTEFHRITLPHMGGKLIDTIGAVADYGDETAKGKVYELSIGEYLVEWEKEMDNSKEEDK